MRPYGHIFNPSQCTATSRTVSGVSSFTHVQKKVCCISVPPPAPAAHTIAGKQLTAESKGLQPNRALLHLLVLSNRAARVTSVLIPRSLEGMSRPDGIKRDKWVVAWDTSLSCGAVSQPTDEMDFAYDLVSLGSETGNIAAVGNAMLKNYATPRSSQAVSSIVDQVRKTPSWPRSWANFSLL